MRERIETQHLRQLESRISALVFGKRPQHLLSRYPGAVLWLVFLLFFLPNLKLWAQVLTQEVLASVAIEKLRSAFPPIAPTGNCAVWRNSLVLPDLSGKDILVISPEKRAIPNIVKLPPELTPLFYVDWASQANSFVGIVSSPGKYALCRFRLRGTAQGGYRCEHSGEKLARLVEPDGRNWNDWIVDSLAISPDAESMWVAAKRQSASGSSTTALWRFIFQSARGIDGNSWVAVEKLDLSDTLGNTKNSIGGMAWWPGGLILALNRCDMRSHPRYVSLLFFPWGHGNQPLVVTERIARGYGASDVADSPSSLWILLRSPNAGEPLSLARIPKIYPVIR
ncbi:MAG: hypothetical protein ACP5QZ_04195 [Candidatus Sumerlaeaceae bacterium]